MENDDNEIEITSSSDEYVTYSNDEYIFDASGPPYTITTASLGTITVDTSSYDSTIAYEDIKFPEYTEFQNTLPDIHKVQQMCEMYPGLKNAYEHFQTIYKLVHDDYLERISNDDDF